MVRQGGDSISQVRRHWRAGAGSAHGASGAGAKGAPAIATRRVAIGRARSRSAPAVPSPRQGNGRPARHADKGAVAAKDDRRKQILTAAVKVFAEKGYHGCRISDVAEEAGVAYGLVYHYYGNKDGLLASVFDVNWAFFSKAVDEISSSAQSMREKLTLIVELAFQAFEMAPLVVKVLVLEFGRNARLGETMENPQVARVFKSIAQIFDAGRKSGELHAGIEPHAMSIIFMGALETAFVSFVLTNTGARSKMQATVTLDDMKRTLNALLWGGRHG